MPSAKYSCSGSPLMFANGRTATEGRSRRATAAWPTSGGGDALHLVRAQRGHVLDLALAQVHERDGEPVPHRALHRVRHGDSAGRGESLQAGRDVHAVAVDAAVGLLDHVAEMHPDAKAHAPIFGHRARGGLEGLLNRQCRRHCPRGRVEHREHRIARHVDDPTLAGFDLSAEDQSRGVQRGDGRALVRGHQPRVAHDVSGEDRREPLPPTGLRQVVSRSRRRGSVRGPPRCCPPGTRRRVSQKCRRGVNTAAV